MKPTYQAFTKKKSDVLKFEIDKLIGKWNW